MVPSASAGYIDDVHGWNVITNSGNMLDDYFHGMQYPRYSYQ